MSVAILFLDAGQENGGAVGTSDLMLDSWGLRWEWRIAGLNFGKS